MSRFDTIIDTALKGMYPKNPSWLSEWTQGMQTAIAALHENVPCSDNEGRTIARKSLGMKRMGTKRWNQTRDLAVQVGAIQFDGSTLLPVLDAEALGGVQVLSRKGVAFLAEAPEVSAEELGFYAGDEDLRLIALQGSNCFGSWSAEEAACAACPLRGHCAPATFDRLEALARDLDLETEEALLAAAKEAAASVAEPAEDAPSGDPEPSAEGEGPSAHTPLAEVAERLGGTVIESSPFEANCFHCPDPIPAGDRSVVIRGKGACHEACARTLAQKEV